MKHLFCFFLSETRNVIIRFSKSLEPIQHLLTFSGVILSVIAVYLAYRIANKQMILGALQHEMNSIDNKIMRIDSNRASNVSIVETRIRQGDMIDRKNAQEILQNNDKMLIVIEHWQKRKDELMEQYVRILNK